MKLIGTKEDLIKRWISEADTLRELAKKMKTERQKNLLLVEARAFEKCAIELEMLEIEQ